MEYVVGEVKVIVAGVLKAGFVTSVTVRLPRTPLPVLPAPLVAASGPDAAILLVSLTATDIVDAALRVGWIWKLSPAAAPAPTTTFRPPITNGLAAVPAPVIGTLTPAVVVADQLVPSKRMM